MSFACLQPGAPPSCVLALIYTPVVTGMQDIFNGIKIRVHLMGKKIELPVRCFEIEFVSKLLCSFDITDLEKRIIVHLIRNTVFIKLVLHQFTAIDVNRSGKQPGLHKQENLSEGLIAAIGCGMIYY